MRNEIKSGAVVVEAGSRERAAAKALGLQIVDWFHHTEKKGFNKAAYADQTFALVVRAEAGLGEILKAGWAAGLPKGSARAGCYELQTDAGIWSSPTRGRLNPSTATFEAWE